MTETTVESTEDTYFVDFGAERKKCDSKLCSAQFWGEKVMLSWAQLEYNHGLAFKKWAETQKCQLRFSEDGCPEVLRDVLKTLVNFAEKKAAVLMKFSHQVEEFRGIRNILVSFETRDYKPTMERLTKDMRNLVTSHKIKEAQAKRERKKQKESIRKMQDKEKPMSESANDVENGETTSCKVTAGQGHVGASSEQSNIMQIETSHKRDFLKYATHLQDLWTKKQKERLCLLLTCIQSFAKKIKASDLERTKDTPLKQIKGIIKESDVNAIVKELENQYTKVHVCPEELEDKDDASERGSTQQSTTLPRAAQEGYTCYIPTRKTVTLPNVETFSDPDSFPRPAIYRKLDNSFKLMTPSFQFRPRLSDKPSGAHLYANCGGNKKLISTSSKQRQLLTPTTVDITGLRPHLSDSPYLDPLENGHQIGDGGVQQDEYIEKRLKACLVPRIPSVQKQPCVAAKTSSRTFDDSLALGMRTKIGTLQGIVAQDGLKTPVKRNSVHDGMKTPIARPSTPVDIQKPPSKSKTMTRARKLEKLTKVPSPASPVSSKTPNLDGDQLKPHQACKVFLKVIATSRKDRVDQIVKKHYGHHRKLNASPQTEKSTRTLVLVRKPASSEDVIKQ